MADKQVKVVGNHVRNCGAVAAVKRRDWATCWGPTAYGERGSPVIKTWRHYGKNGRKLLTWVRFVCNDIDCRAELHVEADFILTNAVKPSRSTRGEGRC